MALCSDNFSLRNQLRKAWSDYHIYIALNVTSNIYSYSWFLWQICEQWFTCRSKQKKKKNCLALLHNSRPGARPTTDLSVRAVLSCLSSGLQIARRLIWSIYSFVDLRLGDLVEGLLYFWRLHLSEVVFFLIIKPQNLDSLIIFLKNIKILMCEIWYY